MTGGLEDSVARLLIGESREMREVRRSIVRFGATSLPVLLQGPTGSGKELAARAIHLASRRQGALVAFNVCALGDGMFEDALFGHVRGAFTGAVREAAGYLAEANGGTAFLDEISGLSLGAQAKLLRALESGVFRPVGGSRDRVSDFRLIAASNESLGALSGEGRFRLDLYHRIGGCVIELPALRDRRDDIPILARHFLAQRDAPVVRIEAEAMTRLQEHHWPGNVRELRHSVERLAVLAGDADIAGEHAELALHRANRSPARASDDQFARELAAMLVATKWDTAEAADRLGVHRATVYRWIERFGLVKPGEANDAREVASERPALRMIG